MNGWNISDQDGENIIKKILFQIFSEKKINKEEIPLLMKKMAQEENIIITKNNKKRNINNYIKNKYGNFNNMYDKILLDKSKFPIFNQITLSNNYDSNIIPNDDDDNNDSYMWILLLGLVGITGFFLFVRKTRFSKLF